MFIRYLRLRPSIFRPLPSGRTQLLGSRSSLSTAAKRLHRYQKQLLNRFVSNIICTFHPSNFMLCLIAHIRSYDNVIVQRISACRVATDKHPASPWQYCISTYIICEYLRISFAVVFALHSGFGDVLRDSVPVSPAQCRSKR